MYIKIGENLFVYTKLVVYRSLRSMVVGCLRRTSNICNC